MSKPKRAVVLLSGGLDSATAAAVAKSEGQEIYALTVDYGQRHKVELEAAAAIARELRIARHEILRVDLRVFGDSALTADIEVPKGNQPESMADSIPVTYVPARNIILLSLALAFAETAGAFEIFGGMNAVDYSGYPDCRPAFLEAFEKTANLATRASVQGKPQFALRMPLLHLNKAEIIRLGAGLGVDYSLTHSCYDPNSRGRACGSCDSCLLRKKGFFEAGIDDPTRYADNV